MTRCRPRHRHQEFLGFLRQIEKSVPVDLDVHLIVDNSAPISKVVRSGCCS
jgi:putative transposase